jgi:hypothetical protein
LVSCFWAFCVFVMLCFLNGARPVGQAHFRWLIGWLILDWCFLVYLFCSVMGFILVCWCEFVCRGGIFIFIFIFVISVWIFWYNLFLFGWYFMLGVFLYPLYLFGCGWMFVLLVEVLRNVFWWLFLLFWVFCFVCVLVFRSALFFWFLVKFLWVFLWCVSLFFVDVWVLGNAIGCGFFGVRSFGVFVGLLLYFIFGARPGGRARFRCCWNLEKNVFCVFRCFIFSGVVEILVSLFFVLFLCFMGCLVVVWVFMFVCVKMCVGGCVVFVLGWVWVLLCRLFGFGGVLCGFLFIWV